MATEGASAMERTLAQALVGTSCVPGDGGLVGQTGPARQCNPGTRPKDSSVRGPACGPAVVGPAVDPS
jgi:hypothetical protein